MIGMATNGIWIQIIAAFGIILSYFAPIQGLIIMIIALVMLDLITAIMKSFKKEKRKGFWNKFKSIKSRKLRRTAIKMFFYISFVMAIFLFVNECFDGTTLLGIPNITAGFLGIVELNSIAENMSHTTGNNLYINVFKRIRKKFEDLISDKIEK